METKEQLLYFFLQGKLSLSQYDYKFLANLQIMVHRDRRVTSNQAELFDKLISKYNKQLVKNNVNTQKILTLPWDSEIIESTPEYTGAMVMIVEDEITIRVPFNKQFISAFRDINNNPYVWDKEHKVYRAAFGTVSLKIARTRLSKYFRTTKVCENIQKILDDLMQYEAATIWDPTLVSINGTLMIAACPSALWESIKDIDLNLDTQTLYQLSQAGVTIDPTLIENDALLNFASNRVPCVEISDMESIAPMIKKLGHTHVCYGRGLAYSKIGKELTQILRANDITIGTIAINSDEKNNKFMLITLNNQSSYAACYPNMTKTIILTDSRPLEIK